MPGVSKGTCGLPVTDSYGNPVIESEVFPVTSKLSGVSLIRSLGMMEMAGELVKGAVRTNVVQVCLQIWATVDTTQTLIKGRHRQQLRFRLSH